MITSFISKMVPVYKNHYSESDLREAILMYKTPIGRKIAEKTPLITQESLPIELRRTTHYFGDSCPKVLTSNQQVVIRQNRRPWFLRSDYNCLI